MNVCQITKAMSAYTVVGLVLATAVAVMPLPVLATDIAWHSKVEPATWHNMNYVREGTAVLNTGEKASTVTYGTNKPLDDKGKTPWMSQTTIRFDDLSVVTMQMAGIFDPTTQVTRGSGEFISGTGRFEGITGKVTLVGQFSGSTMEGDWVGAYSLPGK